MLASSYKLYLHLLHSSDTSSQYLQPHQVSKAIPHPHHWSLLAVTATISGAPLLKMFSLGFWVTATKIPPFLSILWTKHPWVPFLALLPLLLLSGPASWLIYTVTLPHWLLLHRLQNQRQTALFSHFQVVSQVTPHLSVIWYLVLQLWPDGDWCFQRWWWTWPPSTCWSVRPLVGMLVALPPCFPALL